MANAEMDWAQQDDEDEKNILGLLNNSAQGGEGGLDIFNTNRPLDLGEKADDAQDFEDIELSDEEEDVVKEELGGGGAPDLSTIKQETSERPFGDDDLYDEDDLFGDGGRETSPFEGDVEPQENHVTNGLTNENGQSDLEVTSAQPEPEIDLRELNFPAHVYDPDSGDAIPDDPAEVTKLVQKYFPTFQEHTALNWNELFPGKKAFYVPPTPAKPPKPLAPTKVSLEISVDQEKLFRSIAPKATEKSRKGNDGYAKNMVVIEQPASDDAESEDEFDYSVPEDKVGGLTLQDLEIICADFEAAIKEVVDSPRDKEEVEEAPLDQWEKEMFGDDYVRPRKEQKIEEEFVMAPQYSVPLFDNFEDMTVQIAKRPLIDMNDPYLLLDVDYSPPVKRRRLGGKPGDKSFVSALTSRFNYSNDEAYEALKENHQTKVRATLGNITVEHSMPALKLQWPYYRTRLYTREARSFHRPSLKFNKFQNLPIYFSRPGIRKRKTFKGLQNKEIYATTKDLSLTDHYATATLFEYSEEHPTALSNFGMGNRVLNYYRRRNAEDTERPQPEDKIGDAQVLLPEDRSPFANFGAVDPGETVRTLHNEMYRAPIFKHEVKSTDFLGIRSSTGIGGTQWGVRNIDHLFVVGQQLPSMEIPGPHSRRVTNAAKNRMKMLAYRMSRHHPRGEVKIGNITAHITDSTDMQNRQKLKEFMTYDKVDKVWKLPVGDPIREEPQIRSMVKPEDICVIDAMQVGVRHLEDAGLVAEDDVEVDDADEEGGLEQNLAPWRTTKTFLEASADKAMLALVGPGDPSGCGAALSFLKTSMKGGFLENLENAHLPDLEDDVKKALDPKANGGHGYNVKLQQEIYNKAIRGIWERQKSNLTCPEELERDPNGKDDDYVETPMAASANDDTASLYSASTRRKAMKITRKIRNQYGQIEITTETVTNPKIISAYIQRRTQIDMQDTDAYTIDPTGDAETDALRKQIVMEELARLEKNKNRRHAREKQKGIKGRSVSPSAALSPASTPAQSVEKSTGTLRKCANCGQIGHIKTNKKYCPKYKLSSERKNVREVVAN